MLVGRMMCGRLVGCACRVRGGKAGGRPADGERERDPGLGYFLIRDLGSLLCLEGARGTESGPV